MVVLTQEHKAGCHGWEEAQGSSAAAHSRRPPPPGTAGTAAARGCWGRAAPGSRTTLPRGSRGAPIVLRGASGGPPAAAIPEPLPAAAPGGPRLGSTPQLPAASHPPPLGLTANSHRPDCIINVNGAASMSCAGSLGLLLCDTYTGILTRESSITTGVENQPVRDSFHMPREAERLQDCFIKVTENKNY